jgi:zinc metalloprotease ZmpA
LGVSRTEPVAEKVLYARDREPTLAFDVLVKGMSVDGSPSETHYIIDAASNTLLDSFDDVRTFMSRDVAASLQMLAAFECNLEQRVSPRFGSSEAADFSGVSKIESSIENGVSSLAKAAV